MQVNSNLLQMIILGHLPAGKILAWYDLSQEELLLQIAQELQAHPELLLDI